MACLPGVANASAIISNGTVGLGVDNGGQLNIGSSNLSPQGTTEYYGLRSIVSNNEATADGCLCEGWGAAAGGSVAYANNSSGSSFNLISFTFLATSATSVGESTDGRLRITQSYTPSLSAASYQVDVKIENISGIDLTGPTLYRRTMDGDIEPTAFNEFWTIQGTVGATHVLAANDNGFCSSNPLAGCSQILATGDFIDSGPYDHGANSDFTFDSLLKGASQSLTVLYGVATSEPLALTALNTVGAEVYSFGQSSLAKLGTNGDTFIFALKGVGGTVVPPEPGVPEPAVWAMLVSGFGLVGQAMRRRRVAATA